MCIRLNQLSVLLLVAIAMPAFAEALVTAPVRTAGSAGIYTAEGVVESVKTTQIAAETQGSITALSVKAGDVVKAGQVLVRIDTRVARQQVAGSQAQAAAASAQLSAERQAFERKKRLYAKNYISQAALEQAEAEYKSAEAQTRAQQANISIANVRTDLNTIVAPYGGVVAEVNAELGDMALPGKPLLTLYDPKALRVVASVPQNRISQLDDKADLNVEIPGTGKSSFNIPAKQMTILPTADAVSHQVKVRVNLPESLSGTTAGVTPGMFARIGLPIVGSKIDGKESTRLLVPVSAVLHRGELSLLYVIKQGKLQLRQIRPGLRQGQVQEGHAQEQFIEILSGVEAGEQVVVNPLAAVSANQAAKVGR
jgi:multidrug efflux system membrane fusion protein